MHVCPDPIYLMNKLINKVLLIIDNQSSISQQIAILASKEGATVLLAHSSTLPATMSNRSSVTEYFKQDTHSLQDWYHLIEQIRVKYKKIDILVTLNTQNFPSLFSSSNQLNLSGYSSQVKERNQLQYISKTIVPFMEMNGGGSIIRISSITNNSTNLSFLTDVETTDDFIQRNIHNYTQKNIRINTICPSISNTPLLEYSVTNKRSKYKQQIPVSYFINPVDVATTAIYLSCDESSFITGSKLILNGKDSLLNN